MQRGFVYYRTQPIGRNFAPGFTPELTPREMLELGVFEGDFCGRVLKPGRLTLIDQWDSYRPSLNWNW